MPKKKITTRVKKAIKSELGEIAMTVAEKVLSDIRHSALPGTHSSVGNDDGDMTVAKAKRTAKRTVKAVAKKVTGKR